MIEQAHSVNKGSIYITSAIFYHRVKKNMHKHDAVFPVLRSSRGML